MTLKNLLFGLILPSLQIEGRDFLEKLFLQGRPDSTHIYISVERVATSESNTGVRKWGWTHFSQSDLFQVVKEDIVRYPDPTDNLDDGLGHEFASDDVVHVAFDGSCFYFPSKNTSAEVFFCSVFLFAAFASDFSFAGNRATLTRSYFFYRSFKKNRASTIC